MDRQRPLKWDFPGLSSWTWVLKNTLPVWEWEMHVLIFRGFCVCVCFSLFVFSMLTTCCRYPVCLFSLKWHHIIVLLFQSWFWWHTHATWTRAGENFKLMGCWFTTDYWIVTTWFQLHIYILPGQMEGPGSPRFRKLHFPVGLWINSPRKHFAKLGRRWPSAISVKLVWNYSHFSSCILWLSVMI